MPELSRRTFVGSSAILLGSGALAGCTSASTSKSSPAAATSTVLRIAAADATQSTGLDIRTMGFGASYVVLYHLYDSLVYLTSKGFTLGVARSITPNEDATQWTIKLRGGVKFHNGAPLQAADVIFSLKTLASAKSNRASVFSVIDLDKLSSPDPLTVVVPLTAARGDFVSTALAAFSPVIPAGTTNFNAGIGSGPFKLSGQNSTTISLVRNDAYWGPKPTIGGLKIIQIADPTTRLNAVKSGQADYALAISAVGAKAASADAAFQVRQGGAANSQALSFAMNQTLAPFTDPRVSQAVRLAADRNALLTTALLGFGSVGDDVMGKGLAGYDSSLPQRAQDVARAKALFAAAGVTKLSMSSAEIVPGMTNAALLLVQQLAQAGVTLTLNQIPPQSYYASLSALATRPFQAFYYVNRPIAVHLANVTAPGSTFNVTGLGNSWFTQLAAAEAEVDDTKRAAMFTTMQQYLYTSGGDLIWGFQEDLDASRPGIGNVQTIQSTPVFWSATVSS